MKVRIKVTEKDVRDGRVDCFTCPIAARINAVLKDGFSAAVYPTAIEVYQYRRPIRSHEELGLASKSKRVRQLRLPAEGVRFVKRYDGAQFVDQRKRTKPPAPFVVVIPSAYVDRVKLRKAK